MWSIQHSGKANEVKKLVADDNQHTKLVDPLEVQQFSNARTMIVQLLEQVQPTDRHISVSAHGQVGGPLKVAVGV